MKKIRVREAILEAALGQFSLNGYHRTTLAKIAGTAGTSVPNLYVYFGSKLEILYAVFDPWLRGRFAALEAEVLRRRGARSRLERLLHGLWVDLPAADNGFFINVMQALSTAGPAEGYRPTLLRWMERRIDHLLGAALPGPRALQLQRGGIAHLLAMAQDGFVMSRHLRPGGPAPRRAIALMSELMAGARPAGRRTEGPAPD